MQRYYKSNGPNGYTTECKRCTKVYQDSRKDDRAAYLRDYRKRNPEKAKHYIIKSKYGVTKEDFDAMVEASNNRCYACGESEVLIQNGLVRSLNIDHDHATGMVRGLLCNSCNRAIGFAKDNADRLQACAEYLRRASLES